MRQRDEMKTTETRANDKGEDKDEVTRNGGEGGDLPVQASSPMQIML